MCKVIFRPYTVRSLCQSQAERVKNWEEDEEKGEKQRKKYIMKQNLKIKVEGKIKYYDLAKTV